MASPWDIVGLQAVALGPLAAFGGIGSLVAQLQSMQAATIASAQGTNANPQEDGLAELRTQLAKTASRLSEIESTLTPITVQCARETIDKLEIAMTKIYKVAVFIRGDYDGREPDESQRNSLLQQAVQAFQDVEDCTELGLKKISDLHAEVVEAERGAILPAKEKIALLIEQNADSLRNIQEQIRETETTKAHVEESVRQQTDAVNSLQSKISETRDAKLASDIGFSILTLGIGNLINDGPFDPFGLQDQLNDAENSLNSARNALNEACQRLWSLTSTQSGLQIRLDTENQLNASLPGLLGTVNATKTHCVTIQTRFADLKESSSKLLVRVREIQEGAVVTQALAFSKKEFAAGILEICQDCLVDRRVFDEAEMVKTEIINEYGGAVPDEIAEAGASVDEKLKLLGWTGT